MLGDEVMKDVAKRIQQSVRHVRSDRMAADRRPFSPPEDVVARLGGDEFVVLLEDFADVNDGVRVARHIQANLEAPLHIGNHELFVTASIGISTSNRDPEHTRDILRSADSAMYMAKVLGKDRYEIKDPGEPNVAPYRLKAEHDLRKALQHNEFVVHYQPIVDLSDCRISSFEALIRWQHQVRGLVFPGDFLPIADEIGLTPQIGSWVLKEACRQSYMWNNAVADADPVTVCVNLAAKQFDPYRLFAEVKQVIEETLIDPRTLELEVTETLTMQHALNAEAIFRELSTLGVTFSLDDFGTGYSSLTYLQRFPVRKLKIDRSFISGIDRSPESFAIVETIVKLGHILGMKVVGEGIETLEQMKILKGLGCDLGQGNLFSRPVGIDQVFPMMIDRKLGKTLKPTESPRGASEFRFRAALPKDSITSRA
jgi:diguanylate cyclase (GGDEF)-like protein